jgi:hypothetical protein
MDLIHTPKELKNFRKTGAPYDSKSSAWITSFETLWKEQSQVPTGASAPEKTTSLITLSDEALLAEGKRLAGTLPPDPNLLTAAGVTRPMRMGCAARKYGG